MKYNADSAKFKTQIYYRAFAHFFEKSTLLSQSVLCQIAMELDGVLLQY